MPSAGRHPPDAISAGGITHRNGSSARPPSLEVDVGHYLALEYITTCSHPQTRHEKMKSRPSGVWDRLALERVLAIRFQPR